MIMCMKGHNGICPCHMCNIQGICIPSSWITTHYVPLNHDHFSGIKKPILFHSEIMTLFLNKQLKFNCFNHHSLRATCHQVWDQGSTSSHFSNFPLFPPFLSLWFHPSYLVQSHCQFDSPVDRRDRVLTMMIKIMYWCLQYGRQLVRQHTMLVKQFLQHLALGFSI